MDVADQAFAHQVAMSVWREVEAVVESASSFEEAIRQIRGLGSFKDRGDFAPIWKRNWDEAVSRMRDGTTSTERLEVVREAVVQAMEQEDAARQEAGLPRIIDEEEGQRFIDFAMDRLFEEAGGEIEEEV